MQRMVAGRESCLLKLSHQLISRTTVFISIVAVVASYIKRLTLIASGFIKGSLIIMTFIICVAFLKSED